MGRYLCFVKGDWEKGLEYLLWSGNKTLAAVAKKGLAQPQGAGKQFEVGEGWSSLAKKERNTLHKTRYQSRARYWYEKALEKADALTVARIERGMTELGPSSIAPSVHVMTITEFEKVKELYQQSEDRAKSGKATASSIYGNREPQRIFNGNRRGDAWAVNGPDGWLEVKWPAAVFGRYVLLFGRPFPVGNDPWGDAKLTINSSLNLELKNMTSSKVAIIDLKGLTPIHKLRITIDSEAPWYPGLCALEVYPRKSRR